MLIKILVGFIYWEKIVFFVVYLDIVVCFVGGVIKYDGWLEVFKLGRWGSVCDFFVND